MQLSPQEAKALVFEAEAWSSLDAALRKRFHDDDNLKDQALQFVLENLEAKEWARIRAFEGRTAFKSFLGVVVGRLLTDFTRSRFGYVRMPRSIARRSQQDPLWGRAYELLLKKQLSRIEAVEELWTEAPTRDRAELEAIVSGVLADRPRAPTYRDPAMSGAQAEPGVSHEPLEQVLKEQADSLVALAGRLLGEELPEVPEAVESLVARLRPHLDLSDEDMLVLRLRFVDELSVVEVARRLRLAGDPYRHLEKILKRIRKALEEARLT